MDRLRWMGTLALLAVALQGCSTDRATRDGTIATPESRPLVPREVGPVEQSGPIFRGGLSDRGATLHSAPVQQQPRTNWPIVRPPLPATIELPSTAQAAAATRPSTRSVASGQYLSLGSVLVQVNGKPIYADRVLQNLDADLAAKAREMNEEDFREAASVDIEREIFDEVKSELIYAAAMDALTPEEKQLADELTTEWQRKQIDYAGGAIEEAKRRADAEGYPFEQQVADENRTIVNRLYFDKKILPRVQISPQEMRKYYDQHLDQFTKRAQAQFRVIKIDPKKVGSNEEAKKLAEDILQRARHGEDFAALAAKYNSDDYLSRKQGDVGWVERGAYANEKLEQAVWKLNPGQVTDVVEYNGAYYIAKLENVKAGSQSSFDDPKVQDHIREVLSKSQIQDLQQRDVQRLRSQAMVVPDKSARELVGPVLELAMQKYPIWRAGK